MRHKMSYLETRSADLEAVITDLENLNSKCVEMKKIRDSQLMDKYIEGNPEEELAKFLEDSQVIKGIDEEDEDCKWVEDHWWVGVNKGDEE